MVIEGGEHLGKAVQSPSGEDQHISLSIKDNELVPPDIENEDYSSQEHVGLKLFIDNDDEIINSIGEQQKLIQLGENTYSMHITNTEKVKLGTIDANADVTGDNAPKAHVASHANGGSDELGVNGLSGELADNQPPKTHKASHQLMGADQLSVTGLSGLLADDQHVLGAEVSAIITVDVDKTFVNALNITALGSMAEDIDMDTHQVINLSVPADNGDAIRVTANISEAKLEGIAANADVTADTPPQVHAASHKSAGSDELTGVLLCEQLAVNFDDANPVVILATDDAIVVTGVHVLITTAWDGNHVNNVFEVGDAGDLDGFVTDLGGAGANILDTLGFHTESPCVGGGAYLWTGVCNRVKYYSGAVSIRVEIKKDAGCTQGIATVYVFYMIL